MRSQPADIRIAVVGVGFWGSKHLRVLRSTSGVAAVVCVDQRYANATGTPTQVDDNALGYPELANALPDVDAVVIATPPSSHAALGLQAIAAGKHVLIEKPMARTSAEAKALVDAADAAGVVLMPGHTFEYNAAVHTLRDLIRDGELGRLYYLDSARLNLGLYQSDVNVIADLAPHDISIANFVLDSRPTTVTAWGSRHVLPDHEDVAYLSLDYADVGVRANIHVSWLDPRKVRQVTAVGSKRMAIYDDLVVDERIRVYDKSVVPPDAEDGPLSHVAYHLGGITSPYIEFAEPLAVQDQHFVDCIVDGCRPSTDGNSGLDVVQVLECAQISMAEHRPVSLSEVGQHWLAAVPGGDVAAALSRTTS